MYKKKKKKTAYAHPMSCDHPRVFFFFGDMTDCPRHPSRTQTCIACHRVEVRLGIV